MRHGDLGRCQYTTSPVIFLVGNTDHLYSDGLVVSEQNVYYIMSYSLALNTLAQDRFLIFLQVDAGLQYYTFAYFAWNGV